MRINLHTHESHKFFCDWVMVFCIIYNIIMPESTEDEFEYAIENDVDTEISPGQNSNSVGELRRRMIYETRIANHN